MDFKTFFLFMSSTIIIVSQDVHGKESLKPSIASEIEEEMKISYPSWKEMHGSFSVINNCIEHVSLLNQFVNIIDSHIDDDHSKCVRKNKENIKNIIKTAAVAFNNAHFIPFYDKYGSWVQTLVTFVAKIDDEDILNEAIICTEIYKDDDIVFPKNLELTLQCLDKLVFTNPSDKKDVRKMWKMYEGIIEFDKVRLDLFTDLTDKIEEDVNDLNKIIEDCVKEIEEEVINIVHTKESIQEYRQQVLDTITEYLQEIKSQVLSGRRLSENDVKEVFSDTSLMIVRSVRKINILKEEIMKQVTEAEEKISNFHKCWQSKVETEIFEEAYDGIRKCADEMDREQLTFKAAFARIENKLTDILESMTRRLNNCVSRDNSADGLLQSSACIYQVEAYHRKDHEVNVKSIKKLAKVLIADKMLIYSNGVKTCIKFVIHDAENTGKLLVETIQECLKNEFDDDDSDGDEHDEL